MMRTSLPKIHPNIYTNVASTPSLLLQDTSHIPLAGPITHARARQLNQVSSLLSFIHNV
jgi:hypothetical protein